MKFEIKPGHFGLPEMTSTALRMPKTYLAALKKCAEHNSLSMTALVMQMLESSGIIEQYGENPKPSDEKEPYDDMGHM